MHALAPRARLRARQTSAGLWTARFCFADATTAEAFKVGFAKDLQIPPMLEDDPLALIERRSGTFGALEFRYRPVSSPASLELGVA
jgi:hypothetical protein